MKYIDRSKDLELQALFAIQLLVHELKQPRGKYVILLIFFEPSFIFIAPSRLPIMYYVKVVQSFMMRPYGMYLRGSNEF